MAERALLGGIIAAVLTGLARRWGHLDALGQWGAMGCGVACSMAGWSWATILFLYFTAASAVSLLGHQRKTERTQASLPQVRARTLLQVLANGALFSVLALGAQSHGTGAYGVAALGALAAASADTWATEIGTLWGGTPRSIISGHRLGVGMSGGVTRVGFLGALAGAALIAALGAWTLGFDWHSDAALAVAGGGLIGTVADSILGATMQARQWCERCREWTERQVHPCGDRTVHAAGFPWMSNDVVNAAATIVGAVSALGIMQAVR